MILTKIDGDARGGAALSVKEVVGKPILFAGTGEKLEEFEAFHPDRMADRILGMGDVMTLIEKAEASVRHGARRSAPRRSSARARFTLEDFLEQMQQVKKMGPIQNVIGMLPGHAQGSPQRRDRRPRDHPHRGDHPVDDARRAPQARRDQRVAPHCASRGAADVNTADVNNLLKQFKQVQQMMRSMAAGGKGGKKGKGKRQAADGARRSARASRPLRPCAGVFRTRPAGLDERRDRFAFTIRSCVGGQDPSDARRQEEAADVPRRGRDSRSPRDGRFIEMLGQYAPRAEPSVVRSTPTARCTGCDVGAQPTEQVGKLLEIAGVWAAYKDAGGKDAASKPEAEDAQGEEGRREAEPAAARASVRSAAAEAGAGRGSRRRAPRPRRRGRGSRGRARGDRGRGRVSDDETPNDDDVESRRPDEFEDDDDVRRRDRRREGNRVSRCARARPSVEHVARQLVDDPDGVFVDSTERSDNVAILIHTSPGDLGRIIGKRGRVIQALRQVGRAAGATEDVRVTVEVAE